MQFKGTKNYIATEDLKVAVNAAITLQRPLLIKGEPGTGKTVLALEVAKAVKAPLIEWHIKSTTKALQGLYEYDAVSRLRDSQLGDQRVADIRNYIRKGKLWEAFTLDERPVTRLDLLAGLVDAEAHGVELEEQVVRELDVGLVDLVDEEHDLARRLERFAERSELDVLRDVANVAAEARVVQTRDGVVDVEAVLGLRRRLHVPADQRHAEARRQVLGEQGLAGAGLAAHEQRPLERDRDVHRMAELFRRDVAVGALELLERSVVVGHTSRRP